jgi:bifunctional non-homologous end joining protein LigD
MSNATVASRHESISLYFTNGRNSDKEYHIQLVEKEPGYVVLFQYGRRGSALQSGTKTQKPVSYAMAKKIFAKLVKEKIAKGYSPGESGVAYQDTEMESRASGILPQLLNPIEESEIEGYLEDDHYLLQEKKDGERRLLRHTGTSIVGINRKGLIVNLPAPLTEIPSCTPSFLMDGEEVSKVFYGFDLLEIGDRSLVDLQYWERHELLKSLIAQVGLSQIVCVSSFEGFQNKKAAFERFELNKAEGIVFKALSAPYSPGRPASGGTHLKYKFTKSASVFVYANNSGKRSVAIAVFQGDQTMAIGNVTIPVNFDIPKVGDIVDVRYLYAFRGGSLFQPVYLGKRNDLDQSACAIDQLKFKNQSEDSSDE